MEAAWVDQHTAGFKDNVTLKIHTIKKAEDPSVALDDYFETLVETTGVTTQRLVKTTDRRDFSVLNNVHGQALNQDATVLYAENANNAYLVCLSSTHIKHAGRVDLSTAEIIQL